MVRPWVLLFVILFLFPANATEGEEGNSSAADARTLLDRAYRNLYAGDVVQALTISSRLKKGRPHRYDLEIYRKQSVPPTRSLIRFEGPGDVRGTSILIIDQSKRGDDIFVYLPAVGVIRRVAQYQRSDAFFGTDLVYEDLEAKNVDQYELRNLGREDTDEYSCVKIEARAREGFVSAYERTVSCVEPARALVMWMDFYDGDAVLKRLTIDPRSVRLVEGRSIPHLATIRTSDGRSETVLQIHSFQPHEDLPEKLFSASSLERGPPSLKDDSKR